ncbi:MAG: SH3 domain-containing protein [Terrisporobacter sp.]
MIDRKKQYALAMLSATSLLYAVGSTETAYANENVGIVTANVLNVRSGPSTKNRVLGGVTKGQKIEIISSSNGWHKIKYSNKEAWVSGQYVSTNSSSTTSTGKKLISSTNLNVRNGGSTSYSVISYIKKGEAVEMLGTSNTGWYKVKLSNGKIGYASNKYLKEINNNNNNSNNNENTSTIKTLYSKTNLNVRKGPSTNYGVIGNLRKGSSVEVIEYTNNSWYKVKLSNGKIGYCSSSYLSTNKVTTPTEKPEDTNQGNSNQVSKTMTVKAYAYSYGSITATGTVPKAGRTIAVDPKVIPYGSKVYIPQFDKVFIAEDCGGGIKGNKIDIYMNSEKECINWGVKTITIQILK